MCINDRIQAHRIVKTRLDITGSMRCRAVVVTYTNRKRFYAALKIRSYRCSKNTELIFGCRLNTYYRIRAEHIRAQIKRCAASVRRYKSFVCLDYLLNRLNKLLLGIYRHLKSGCRLLKSLAVQIRAEHYGSSVLSRISLQPFKNSLGILQYTGALVQYNVCIRG